MGVDDLDTERLVDGVLDLATRLAVARSRSGRDPSPRIDVQAAWDLYDYVWEEAVKRRKATLPRSATTSRHENDISDIDPRQIG